MPRKRKAPATSSKSAAPPDESPPKSAAPAAIRPPPPPNLVQAVVKNAQANEAFQTKYIKELKQIYATVRSAENSQASARLLNH